MKLGEINPNLKPPKKSLFLCKPDKKTIAKITEAYDVQYYTKLSTLNELSFKIPTVIIKDGIPMDNENIERIKHRYLFKLKFGNITEYFLFNESNKIYGDDEYIEYRALSLGVQLADKNIRQFSVEKGDLQSITNEILSNINTNWKVGYVDSEFITSPSNHADRAHEIPSQNALEAIYDLATKWNAVILWDTVKLTISFYKPENVGLNKGFYIRDGKYLDSFDLSTNTYETITRLKVYGKDGMSIERVNPSGQSYLEDFTYYMYPFKREGGVVVSSSYYMSDSLCIALEDYYELLESKQTEFQNITTVIATQLNIISNEQATLKNLQNELVILEDKRDILLASQEFDKPSVADTPEHAQIIADIEAKRAQINNQIAFIDDLEFQLRDYEAERNALRQLLSWNSNFTKAQQDELKDFIIEKEYTNDVIFDDELLIKEGKEVFRKFQEPAIKFSMGIVDFTTIVESQNDWDKLDLGDTIRIKYDRLKVYITAKIIEINYDFENSDIQLTIANEKDVNDDALIELLNKADSTSTIVSLDKYKWDLAEENNGMVNDLINSKWDALKQAILAGYDQQITISERGITVKAIDDPMSWLVIQNGFLAITNDGGNTWKHAISKDGIWGEYIFGKIISGVNLRIEDASGIWLTKGSRTTIFDRYGTEVMRLGLVSDNMKDEHGNLIPQANECFGMISWNDVTKVAITDCEGISISRKKGDDWEKVLWANTDGTLYTHDLVAEGIKIVNNIGELILDAENNYFNIGLFKDIVADGKLTTLEKLQIITELYKIHSDYKLLLNHAEKYIRSSKDNVTDVEGAWNQSTGSFPTVYSTTDRYSTSALQTAYLELITYISSYIKVINNGATVGQNLLIDAADPLTESTSEISDRSLFIQKFRNYYEEATRLREAIEDSIFYSGIHMGEYTNNLIMNEFGFIAVRNDGRYRAYLNATNGLALQKWENGKWVSKLFATLGDPMWEDGTLYAEGLVTKNLRIVDGQMGDAITFDWYDGITIYGQNGEVIKLNANEAISIYVDGERKFYVGTDGRLYAIDLNAYNVYAEKGEFHDIEVYNLYAENVEAHDITAYGLKIIDGNLGEKIILHNQDGITINGNNGEQIRLNANEGIAIDAGGENKFWIGTDGNLYAKRIIIVDELTDAIKDIDGSFISDLTVNRLITLNSNSPQDVVHIEDNYIKFKTDYGGGEKTKLKISFNGSGSSAYPEMIWGEESGNELGKIYKDTTKFAFEYNHPSNQSKILMNETDTDGEGQALYLKSTGGIRLDSAKKVVMRTSEEKYLRVVESEDTTIKFGSATIKLTSSEVMVKFNDSNYIKISSSGVDIKGSKINLN